MALNELIVAEFIRQQMHTAGDVEISKKRKVCQFDAGMDFSFCANNCMIFISKRILFSFQQPDPRHDCFHDRNRVLLIETKKSSKQLLNCTVENVDDLLNYFSNSPNQFFTSVNRESIASADNGT
ncbi:hypothetical protein T4D_16786 [Trichinella pseudospiralis]|uniref:Uncharacterized protein n=1 Tax=Trichinella pseudospiralis TaxID=6337 RepID=A0A0V1FC59_TRIPS|nr:hypothetical protein T4D_16786 [Trichinella pseudospiralis]